MNRQRRSTYMAEMGIEHWVPVRALQGAAQGHWVATAPRGILKAGLHSAVESPLDSSAPAAANRGRAIAKVLDLVDNSGQASKSAKASTQAAAAITTVSPELSAQQPANTLAQFTLASVVCDDILLVDDITAMQFAPSAYQNWINALLFSLARPIIRGAMTNNIASNVNDSGGRFDRFSWPLPDSDLFDNTEQGAKEVVAAWLQRKLQENKPSWVVLMGDAAIAALSGLTASPLAAHRGAVIEFAGQPSIQALTTFGTGQLWREPLLKAKFWQHMQQLPAAMPDSNS